MVLANKKIVVLKVTRKINRTVSIPEKYEQAVAWRMRNCGNINPTPAAAVQLLGAEAGLLTSNFNPEGRTGVQPVGEEWAELILRPQHCLKPTNYLGYGDRFYGCTGLCILWL